MSRPLPIAANVEMPWTMAREGSSGVERTLWTEDALGPKITRSVNVPAGVDTDAHGDAGPGGPAWSGSRSTAALYTAGPAGIAPRRAVDRLRAPRARP